MNIASSTPYSGISHYPVPARVDAGRRADVDADSSSRSTSSTGSATSNPNPVSSREQVSGSENYSSYERTLAAERAELIRGRLASDTHQDASIQRALSAYQNVEVQDKRDSVSQSLGIDIFV